MSYVPEIQAASVPMPEASAKRIVLTGATRGLGRALTDRFIEEGHHVFGCGRSQSALDELQSTYASPHTFTAIDTADESAVERWANEILEEYGPPDLLINNAAVINRNASLWEVPSEEFSRLIDINIKGVANVLRHFVPAMVRKRSGVIINFSSTWGRSTSADAAPYCASKFAIEGLTQALAQEIPVGMAAIPFNPGVINTDMLQSCFGEGAHHYPTADEWSQTAAPYLLSLGPKHNGQSLTAPV